MNFYSQIFRRKSFHLCRDTGKLSEDDISKLDVFINSVNPLYSSIRTNIVIVPESETTCKRGAEYCILFYSVKKGEYLRNIGYIGEQIDLYLASESIAALWYGLGRPKQMKINDLDFVIMIAIAKMPENKFRKDMFKSKRKPIDEIWMGETLSIAEIVRFAPSACNTQPWFTENTGEELIVYRCKKPGKRGIMPAGKVGYYNRIDVGIYLFMLETCLSHEGYMWERTLYDDNAVDSIEKVKVARYQYKRVSV